MTNGGKVLLTTGAIVLLLVLGFVFWPEISSRFTARVNDTFPSATPTASAPATTPAAQAPMPAAGTVPPTAPSDLPNDAPQPPSGEQPKAADAPAPTATPAPTPTVPVSDTTIVQWELVPGSDLGNQPPADATTMQEWTISIPAGGYCLLIGSPMEFAGQARMYDAGKGEAQAWVFYNVSHETHSLTLKAWGGSNAIACYRTTTGTLPAEEQILADAMSRLEGFIKNLLIPGNCDVDGCTPSLIGYLYWRVTNNDSAEQVYSFNPAQDPGDTRYAKNHEAILKALGVAK